MTSISLELQMDRSLELSDSTGKSPESIWYAALTSCKSSRLSIWVSEGTMAIHFDWMIFDSNWIILNWFKSIRLTSLILKFSKNRIWVYNFKLKLWNFWFYKHSNSIWIPNFELKKLTFELEKRNRKLEQNNLMFKLGSCSTMTVNLKLIPWMTFSFY